MVEKVMLKAINIIFQFENAINILINDNILFEVG
jgi:hypothetical protein